MLHPIGAPEHRFYWDALINDSICVATASLNDTCQSDAKVFPSYNTDKRLSRFLQYICDLTNFLILRRPKYHFRSPL